MGDLNNETKRDEIEPGRLADRLANALRRSLEFARLQLFNPLWVGLKALFWRLPVAKGIVRRAHLKARTEAWSRTDAKRNEETSPPPGEVVTLQGLWAMEFYTPSHAEQLLTGFRELGWDHDQFVTRNVASWVQRGRETQESGWLNLGTIQRAENAGAGGIHRTAPLPVGVKFADGAVLTLTSSLTCVVLFFAFDETCSDELQSALTTYRRTYLEPLRGGGFSVVEPEHQKQKAVLQARARLRFNAWEWFRSHLPGVFSSEPSMPKEFPTCELVTMLLGGAGFEAGAADGSRRDFLRILDLDHMFDAWKIENIQTLRFLPLRRSDFSHAIISVKEEELREAAKAHHFGEHKSGMLGYANDTFHRFLTRWGLVGLLGLFQRRINSLRDSNGFRFESRKASLSTIRKLSEIEFQGLDVSAVSDELEIFSKEAWFSHGVTDFSPIDTKYHSSSYTKSLRSYLRRRAKSIQSADKRLRQFLSQQGILLASYENIALQRRMRSLTALTVIVSVLALLVAIVADPTVKNSLAEWFASFRWR
jgi:hypothetical protein